MSRSGVVHHVARLAVKFLRLAIRKSELAGAVGQKHYHCSRMTVHHGFLVWAVVRFQDPHPVIVGYQRVMLGIGLDGILGYHHRRVAAAQQGAQEKYSWCLHIVLLTL